MSQLCGPARFVGVLFGSPYTTSSLPAASHSMQRSNILRQTWRQHHVFDEWSEYAWSAEMVPELSWWERALAHTLYDPAEAVSLRWERVGAYSPERLIDVVATGVERDDDIIQQWFGSAQVLQLLRAAGNWSETLLAVDAISGAHEWDSDVADYVQRVLGDAG